MSVRRSCHGLLAPLGRFVRERRFPPAKAGAWLVHNVEEVGNLPHFLPDLFERRGARSEA